MRTPALTFSLRLGVAVAIGLALLGMVLPSDGMVECELRLSRPTCLHMLGG